jgi:hypothetical protein
MENTQPTIHVKAVILVFHFDFPSQVSIMEFLKKRNPFSSHVMTQNV